MREAQCSAFFRPVASGARAQQTSCHLNFEVDSSTNSIIIFILLSMKERFTIDIKFKGLSVKVLYYWQI